MQLTYTITPEDYEKGFYTVEWVDTVGQAIGETNPIHRPYEVWCVITNKQNDTLGYYTGMSTPMPFSYFQSHDSLVYLNFMVGPNLFTTLTEYHDKSNPNWLVPIIFEPVEVNLKKDLFQPKEMILTERN